MAILPVKNCLFIIVSLSYAASATVSGTSPPRGGAANKCSQQNLWFYFNSTTKAYNCTKICSKITGIECFESGPALAFGYCATYSEDTRSLSIISECPYFQYGVYNVTVPLYIPIPTTLSELNDYTCGPLHRKGFVCSECVDGFGPSLTSFGLRCVDCTDAWYRVPLFLVVEFVPITVFYIIVVTFQISVTSAPMPCFTMYAQLVVIALDGMHPQGQMSAVYYTNDEQLKFLDLRIVYVLYGIFNLDFFRSVLPPLCVSHKLKFIHTVLFGYISVIYPIVLIGLTWVCVELHGRNYRLLRCLWKTFRICFSRQKITRGWDKKTDFVEVFATFLLLSYNKCIYQMLSYSSVAISEVTTIDQSGNISSVNKESIDGSYAAYLCYVVPVVFMSSLYITLPLLLLIFYPCKPFRSCVSKCHLDFIVINTFVERFHGSYRNGLDGSHDMRSFSGLYFVLRIVVCLLPSLSSHVTKDFLFDTGAIFLIVALFVALAKPYKKAYANILDVFLLSDLALLCFYTSPWSTWFSEMIVIPRILMMIPLVIFSVIVLCKVFYKLNKHMRNLKLSLSHVFSWWQSQRAPLSNETTQNIVSAVHDVTSAAEQPLISPTWSNSNCYGTNDS